MLTSGSCLNFCGQKILGTVSRERTKRLLSVGINAQCVVINVRSCNNSNIINYYIISDDLLCLKSSRVLLTMINIKSINHSNHIIHRVFKIVGAPGKIYT